MQLDAVLFDLDDTLCRYRRTGDELLATAFERIGREPFISRSEYHDRYPEFVGESESMVDLRERCFTAIAREKGIEPDVGRRVARAYADERDHGNVEPMPGLEAALEAVSSRPVALVTNGSPEMQRRKLEALGLEDRFDVVVHGGYDAPAKPDPEPFDRALSTLEASPKRSLHVGNSLETDVAGALAAGVRAVWVPDGPVADEPTTDPDHRIESLAALPSLLSGNARS